MGKQCIKAVEIARHRAECRREVFLVDIAKAILM
jgi:hypothetical protein